MTGSPPLLPAASSSAAAVRPQFFGGIGSLIDRGEAAADSVGRQVGSAADRLGPDRLLDSLEGTGRGVADRVESLPVGGAAAIGGLVEMARQTVLTTLESVTSEAAGVAEAVPGVGNVVSSIASLATGGEGEAGAQVAGGDVDSADGAPDSDNPGDSSDIIGVTGPSASAAGDPYSRMSELIENLEERLLAEIERRGGRFAGIF